MRQCHVARQDPLIALTREGAAPVQVMKPPEPNHRRFSARSTAPSSGTLRTLPAFTMVVSIMHLFAPGDFNNCSAWFAWFTTLTSPHHRARFGLITTYRTTAATRP